MAGSEAPGTPGTPQQGHRKRSRQERERAHERAGAAGSPGIPGFSGAGHRDEAEGKERGEPQVVRPDPQGIDPRGQLGHGDLPGHLHRHRDRRPAERVHQHDRAARVGQLLLRACAAISQAWNTAIGAYVALFEVSIFNPHTVAALFQQSSFCTAIHNFYLFALFYSLSYFFLFFSSFFYHSSFSSFIYLSPGRHRQQRCRTGGRIRRPHPVRGHAGGHAVRRQPAEGHPGQGTRPGAQGAGGQPADPGPGRGLDRVRAPPHRAAARPRRGRAHRLVRAGRDLRAGGPDRGHLRGPDHRLPAALGAGGGTGPADGRIGSPRNPGTRNPAAGTPEAEQAGAGESS